MNNLKFLIVFFIIFSVVDSSKILGVFPFPSKSHVILGTALLKELAIRGHEVTMISSYPLDQPLKNYKDVVLTEVLKVKDEKMSTMFSPNGSLIQNIQMGLELPYWFYDSIMNDPNMIKFMESNEKYDVVIMSWAFIEALSGLAHKVDAPMVAFSVMGNSPFINYLFNVPNPYSYVPSGMLATTDDMTFIDRVYNALSGLLINIFYQFFLLPIQRNILKKYFPEAPSLDELLDDIDLALVSSHFSTETPRPGFPNIIQIGGFHLYENEKLPREFQDYLDKSKNGVVLFSLGTNVKAENLPVGAMETLLEAFRKLKYDILWKIDAEIKNLPKNIKIVKWLPQRAVLAHPNIKAFITHGGLGGTVEAIYNAVPMVGLPFFADQFRNILQYEKKGIAIQLDVQNLTETGIIKAISEIIENPFYRKNIDFQSDIYRNQEMNPMDKAVFWVEHVIKHKGAKHLKSRASKIPFYQYYLLDVMSFILLLILSLITAIWFVFKIIKKCCCKKQKVKTT